MATTKYLLDTCTIIELLNKNNDFVFFEILRHDLKNICVPIVSVAELEYGVQKSQLKEKNLAKIQSFLERIEVLPLNLNDAKEYGEIRAELERKGRPIGANDMFIAAQARSRNMVLVTSNICEFTRVPGLTVEDWC